MPPIPISIIVAHFQTLTIVSFLLVSSVAKSMLIRMSVITTISPYPSLLPLMLLRRRTFVPILENGFLKENGTKLTGLFIFLRLLAFYQRLKSLLICCVQGLGPHKPEFSLIFIIATLYRA